MVSLKTLLTLGLAGASASKLPPTDLLPGQHDTKPGCGEVDLFFTGLPAYHPFVIGLGLDPAMVDQMLRADAQAVINAGYNLKVALAGPEVGVEVLEAEMQGQSWGGAGIGFGVRSAQDPDMTLLFIDTIDAMRRLPVEGPIVFNYNAKTFLWALQQRIPLSENCTTPGTDYGFKVFCDVCEQ
ncbi:hypothetical protein N3K66_000260 [Trichothecium roseum]|uniref:Uncharacterized protein n=1 Tax=Trichothecium roseum TaxID=47278 RepID=A0ACC0VB98_9HYPO|nr:hypothetical protein N3K66_000260 [Trichothecium roseum]